MIRFVRFAGSLATGIFLLVLILLASVAGVLLPQGVSAHAYSNQFGTVVGSMMASIGMNHLFTSVWYTALLLLFAVNISFCTATRLVVSVKNIAKQRFLSPAQIRALALHDESTTIGSTETVAGCISKQLRKTGFNVAVKQDANTILVDARKGRFHEIGSALLHFSLIPLLIGGFVAKFTGYSYVEMLRPGQIAPIKERSFSVRCDFFKLERNELGAVKDYISGLSILDSAGRVLVSKSIEVNHPLTYEGITLYQSSYSADGSEISNVNLVITGPDAGAVGKSVNLSLGMPDTLEATGITILADHFIPDFVFDTETRTPQSRSKEHNNPALHVTLCLAKDTLFSGWIFQKFGTMHHENNEYNVAFVAYEQQQTTGLLIKKNPGNPVIWFGILGMSLGVLLVFWIPRRRIWAVIASGAVSGNADVTFGGTLQKEDITGSAMWEALRNSIVGTDCK